MTAPVAIRAGPAASGDVRLRRGCPEAESVFAHADVINAALLAFIKG
jgi:hypothetical protein